MNDGKVKLYTYWKTYNHKVTNKYGIFLDCSKWIYSVRISAKKLSAI